MSESVPVEASRWATALHSAPPPISVTPHGYPVCFRQQPQRVANDTELALIRLFRRHRITGWRRHRPVFGKPDFVFSQIKLAVFVDGCFWHQCAKHSNVPANNRAFWERKLAANCRRDRLVRRTLRARGWRVLRVWEHELARRNERRLLARLRRATLMPLMQH